MDKRTAYALASWLQANGVERADPLEMSDETWNIELYYNGICPFVIREATEIVTWSKNPRLS